MQRHSPKMAHGSGQKAEKQVNDGSASKYVCGRQYEGN